MDDLAQWERRAMAVQERLEAHDVPCRVTVNQTYGPQSQRTLNFEPGAALQVMLAEIVADRLDERRAETATQAATLHLSAPEGADA